MYGAILGDIIGSPYEYHHGERRKDFPLFIRRSRWTDDTILTAAVADALMTAGPEASEEEMARKAEAALRRWALMYPHAGYGGMFKAWFMTPDAAPYDSYGNGAAMRVSAAGWLYDSLPRTLRAARAVTLPTHGHPEGIRGAEATVAAIYFARCGASKKELLEAVTSRFGYELYPCDAIRRIPHLSASCMNALPAALSAFAEGRDFEDVVRTAVSLGNDTDTVGAIAGSIAEAYYGVPDALRTAVRRMVTVDVWEVIERFERAKMSPAARP